MRTKLYNFLVNRCKGISYRYHKVHDNTSGITKIVSWLYLLWLNFAYHFLKFKFLGKVPSSEQNDEKRLANTSSESEMHFNSKIRIMESTLYEKIKECSVLSFDIFDTLIFRSVSQPTDVFYYIGERFGVLDFKSIRIWAESDARNRCYSLNSHCEVSLADIWNNLACDVDGMEHEAFVKKGQIIEQNIEKSICYANPFMLSLWNKLLAEGKQIIVVSDMYLPSETLKEILEQKGFTGFSKLYVSCEYGLSKAEGSLYEVVKADFPGKKILHIGDNIHSDVEMAKKHGLSSIHYQNVNKNMIMYRPYDMSYMIGSTYRALVSSHLYNGLNQFTMEYEYGFIYGGLFALGYCHFIHEYAVSNAVDRILFLSRDGDILKQVYERLYPDEHTEYVYWSRKAATKLMAACDKHDFFRRFIYHKQNQKYTIMQVLGSMELGFLAGELSDWKDINDSWNVSNLSSDELKKQKFIDLTPDDELTDRNGYLLRRFIEAKWDKVMEAYAGQQAAADKYYKEILNGVSKAVAVDIGWAGSGAMALRYLTEHVWNIPCKITGIIAGTNTVHNAEPDASEPFLQSGKLVSYLYSQAHNRDLLKKHDPNKDYNVYWELLLSSPTPQFKGFYKGNNVCGKDDRYIEDLDITLCFGEYDFNQAGIVEIQKGILDFAKEYLSHWGDPINGEFSYMYNISGRDAYAPMLVAASHNERYLKAIAKKFRLEKNVV